MTSRMNANNTPHTPTRAPHPLPPPAKYPTPTSPIPKPLPAPQNVSTTERDKTVTVQWLKQYTHSQLHIFSLHQLYK